MEHDKGSGAINRVCKFPVVKCDMFEDDNDPAVLVNDYFNGDIETVTINPLVRAIQLRAHKVLFNSIFLMCTVYNCFLTDHLKKKTFQHFRLRFCVNCPTVTLPKILVTLDTGMGVIAYDRITCGI